MKHLPDLFRRDSFGLMSSNPFHELLRMQRQMDQMASELWSGGGDVFSPSCDVDETDTHYLMSFDLPGVKKEDIKIGFQDGLITVSGDRKSETEKKGKGLFRVERFQGAFSRSFQLPAGIRPEQVEASYDDGVLRVVVPKAEAAKYMQIKIGEGKPKLFEKAA